MNKGVEHEKEADDRCLGGYFDCHVPQNGHQGVVVEVEKPNRKEMIKISLKINKNQFKKVYSRNLTVLLSQHKEHRIEEVHEASQVAEVANLDLPQSALAKVRRIGKLEIEKAPAVVDAAEDGHEEEDVHHDHEEVVEEHRAAEDKGGPTLHQVGPNFGDEEEVEADDGEHGPGAAGDQGKVGRPRVGRLDPVVVGDVPSGGPTLVQQGGHGGGGGDGFGGDEVI